VQLEAKFSAGGRVNPHLAIPANVLCDWLRIFSHTGSGVESMNTFLCFSETLSNAVANDQRPLESFFSCFKNALYEGIFGK
jgi:hypothetical protein